MRFIYNNCKTKVQENRILRPQKANEMNFRKYVFAAIIAIAALYACNNDDDDGIVSVPVRDRAEQQIADDQRLQDYLRTHFYTLVDVDLNNDGTPEYQTAKFDTIAGSNSGEQPIMDSPLLETKAINSNDVDYTLYILNFNQGGGERQPTFADSSFVTYRGALLYDNVDKDGDGIPDVADVDADGDGAADELDGEIRTDSDGDGIADDSDADDDGVAGTDPGQTDTDVDGIIDDKDPVDNNDPDRRVFDSAITPIWFDLINLIQGFRESTVDFKGATGFVENPDGTVSYNNDFGNFTVFIPSGLGYFASSAPGGGIPLYSSLIFSIQTYSANESDHDNDGIPSYLEDIDNDRSVVDTDDDTDENGFPNYIDGDDDGDGTPTSDEITLLGDLNGDNRITLDEITFYDDDGDGTPNHLDPDDSDFKND
ncbi:hypothetical protein [Aquimarina sp. 2201CG5-10]|uniref:FKBP-type peptidyl-prolyl cis-trans isomerase n=1 Tax=Aquimarina callyspongiae TaxID=3098150 RepID=UPI002AB527D6|nr:hypothetical protein [Aquimarina sp. 2201CG5-10]MDY8137729.1 hypothetical protein [Aquimarina sp. 2201CG5-10]